MIAETRTDTLQLRIILALVLATHVRIHYEYPNKSRAAQPPSYPRKFARTPYLIWARAIQPCKLAYVSCAMS